eukprot:434910-Amphidinium_carterae.1
MRSMWFQGGPHSEDSDDGNVNDPLTKTQLEAVRCKTKTTNIYTPSVWTILSKCHTPPGARLVRIHSILLGPPETPPKSEQPKD